jgi:hypothetical protein
VFLMSVNKEKSLTTGGIFLYTRHEAVRLGCRLCCLGVYSQIFGHVVLFTNKEGEMKKIKGMAVGVVVLFVLSFVIPVNLMAQGASPSGKNDSVVLGTGGAGAAAGAGATAGVSAGTVAAGLAVVGVTAAVIAASSSSSTTPHH